MTALTVLLHAFHLEVIHQIDYRVTSAVLVRTHELSGAVVSREMQKVAETSEQPLSVQLIELGAHARMQAFEASKPDYETVERLQGARPLDRSGQIAILNALADNLQQAHLAAKQQGRRALPQVLAIDFDLAPLPGEPLDQASEVLKRLRKFINVVVITLPHGEGETDKARVAGFMSGPANCNVTVPPVDGQYGLYFASPLVHRRQAEGPLSFATVQSHRKLGEPPTWFPALGTLSHALWQPGDAIHAGNAEHKAKACALTMACRQARGLPIEGNCPAPVSEERKADAHEWEDRYYNWPLLQSERLIFSPVESDRRELQKGWDDPGAVRNDVVAQLRTMPLTAPILLLSVDGGGGYDQLPTPAALPAPVNGATFHALQALSLDKPLSDQGRFAWWGAFVDLVIGLVFVLLVTPAMVLLHRLKPGWPQLWMMLSALTPMLLGALLFWASLYLAAFLMVHCFFWFNPIYVLIGLLLHTYVEGWSEAAHSSAHAAEHGREHHAHGAHRAHNKDQRDLRLLRARRSDRLLAWALYVLIVLAGFFNLLLKIK
ncbi:hypothetical protein [Paucibacter sp. KCTC 42545]|uniref:hypothetical protein n=1 Tax=Paucibacter sp. KCTC 42545 TaxID=1768242 RepID=UPI0012E348DE|nr:hypothetical protein [Paucibacter sp. KCTC 42545]